MTAGQILSTCNESCLRVTLPKESGATLAALQSRESLEDYNQTVASGFVGVSAMGYIPKKDAAHGLLPLFSKHVAENLKRAAARYA
jgi:hypothetical protein